MKGNSNQMNQQQIDLPLLNLSQNEQNSKYPLKIIQILVNNQKSLNQVKTLSFASQMKEISDSYKSKLRNKQIKESQQNMMSYDIVKKKLKTEQPINQNNRQINLGQAKKTQGLVLYQEKQFQMRAQKARLANEIIKIIESPKYFIKQKSLQKQIFQLIQQQEICFQQILNLFHKGIILDSEIYSQKRFGSTRKPQTEKTIFYPTSSFTGQMFKRMKVFQRVQEVVMGHVGISKTMSTILYQKLSDFIVDYRLKVDILDESQQSCSKIIYWTINMANDTQQSVNDIILKQFTPIQTEYLKDFFKVEKLKKGDIKWDWKRAFQMKKIRVIFVVDQINDLIEQISNKKYDRSLVAQDKNMSKFKKIIDIENIINSRMNSFDKVMFLSSMNIQTELLMQLNFFYNNNQRQDLKLVVLDLSLKLQQQQGKLQMIAYFVRVFFEYFPPKFQQMQKLMQCIVMKIYKQLKPQRAFYLTHLVIRRYIKRIAVDRYTLKKNPLLTHFEMLLDKIKSIFYYILDEQMPRVLSQKAIHFIKNNPQLQILKSQLILEIYRLFQINEAQKKPRQTLIQISTKQFSVFQSYQDLQKLKLILDKNLFKFNSYNSTIKLIIPPQVFLNLHIDYKQTTLIDFAIGQLAKVKYEALVQGKNHKTIGEKVEYYLKKILTHGGTSLFFVNQDKQIVRQFLEIEKNHIFLLPISENKSQFSQILKQKGFFASNISRYPFFESVKTQLIKIIQDLKFKENEKTSKQNFYYVFTSGKKFFTSSLKNNHKYVSIQQMFQFVNHRNKAIDLMLVSFENKQKISFSAIDVTIDCHCEVINKKITKFLKCFQQFNDKNQNTISLCGKTYQIELNYYIISPIEKPLKIRSQLNKIIQIPQYGFIYDDKWLTILKSQHKQFKLLNQIGHLSLTSNLLIKNSNKNIIDLKVYNKLAHTLYSEKQNPSVS